MDCKTAIEVIKKNYPPENYTMLREALDLAIQLMQKEIKEQPTNDFDGRKIIKVPRG